MLRLSPLLLLVACATPPVSDYVPGGAGLPREAREDYRRALFEEHSGEGRKALATLGSLCSRYPTRLGLHLHRLRLARAVLGDEQAARLYLVPPPGVDASRAEIFVRLARTPEENRTDRADVLQFALEQEPDEAFWQIAVAEVELSSHDPEMERSDGERRLGRVRAADEARAKAKKHLDEAKTRAEKALDLDPMFAEAHILIAYIYTSYADRAEATEAKDSWRKQAGERYTRALQLDPESLTARLNRAENHLYFDNYTEAIDDLTVAVRVAPNVPVVWSNLGSVYYSTGLLTKAVDCYRKVLAIEPGDARARAAYADCLRRQGEAKRAVAALRQARTDAGEDHELLAEIAFKLGTIYEHEARYRKAVQEYELHIHNAKLAGLSGASASKARTRIRHIIEHAFE